MDIKIIEKLMAAMNRNGMRKLFLKEEGVELELEKDELSSGRRMVEQPLFVPAASVSEKTIDEKENKQPPGGRFITSPMVGTFYLSPSPKDPPYVKVGDTIDEDTVVCIIEAMKVMNEVKAGMNGTIAEILVKNGDPVEFGTNIFRII